MVLIASLAGLTGCAEQRSGQSDLASDNRPVISWNVISWNVISWNVISWNAIAAGRLSGNEIQYSPLPNPIEGTPEGRLLIQYLARCSLRADDILVVEDDGVTYQYPGLLALAPSWENQALSVEQQRLISACLIAHINALGESVPISTRAAGLLHADSVEIAAFPVYEGTFFGQVFSTDQKMYSCQGDSPTLSWMQSPDRARRLCTDEDDACAVVALGRCRDICERRDAKYGWTDCWAEGVKYEETISVFLAADDSGDTQTCGPDNACSATCSGTECTGHIDCQDAATCAARCLGGAACNIDCYGAADCSQTARDDSIAELDCQLTDTCASNCTDASDCEIDCGGARQCDSMVCRDQARCLLDCTDAVSCGFAVCEGAVKTCPGDIVVCNRPCP